MVGAICVTYTGIICASDATFVKSVEFEMQNSTYFRDTVFVQAIHATVDQYADKYVEDGDICRS